MLDQERAYYTQHEPEWIVDHKGHFVVVKGTDVVGFFDTMNTALSTGASKFGMNSFLVRRVGEPSEPVSIPALTLGLLGAGS